MTKGAIILNQLRRSLSVINQDIRDLQNKKEQEINRYAYKMAAHGNPNEIDVALLMQRYV